MSTPGMNVQRCAAGRLWSRLGACSLLGTCVRTCAKAAFQESCRGGERGAVAVHGLLLSWRTETWAFTALTPLCAWNSI